jgi:hypothetical protein
MLGAERLGLLCRNILDPLPVRLAWNIALA